MLLKITTNYNLQNCKQLPLWWLWRYCRATTQHDSQRHSGIQMNANEERIIAANSDSHKYLSVTKSSSSYFQPVFIRLDRAESGNDVTNDFSVRRCMTYGTYSLGEFIGIQSDACLRRRRRRCRNRLVQLNYPSHDNVLDDGAAAQDK